MAIAPGSDDGVKWHCAYRIEKRWGDDQSVEPYEVIEGEGNLLTNLGARALWDRLTGLAAPTLFSNANSYIGVGDNANADVTAAAADTDLATAGANKLKKGMDASYPLNNGSQGIDFRATFTTGEANFKWLEWGVFNGGTAFATGTMLNHKGYTNSSGGLGTKTSAASWTLTVTLTIS